MPKTEQDPTVGGGLFFGPLVMSQPNVLMRTPLVFTLFLQDAVDEFYERSGLNPSLGCMGQVKHHLLGPSLNEASFWNGQAFRESCTLTFGPGMWWLRFGLVAEIDGLRLGRTRFDSPTNG